MPIAELAASAAAVATGPEASSAAAAGEAVAAPQGQQQPQPGTSVKEQGSSVENAYRAVLQVCRPALP